jgi:dTDP-4-amino-4,6-dideoxygalactose transaminase
MINFNKPYLTGKEMHYMYQAVYSGKISETVYLQKNARHFLKTSLGLRKLYLPPHAPTLWKCVQFSLN